MIMILYVMMTLHHSYPLYVMMTLHIMDTFFHYIPYDGEILPNPYADNQGDSCVYLTTTE